MPLSRGTGFSREGAGRHTAGFDGVQTGLFPAEAGPTMRSHAISGTGFSREGAGRHTAKAGRETRG